MRSRSEPALKQQGSGGRRSTGTRRWTDALLCVAVADDAERAGVRSARTRGSRAWRRKVHVAGTVSRRGPRRAEQEAEARCVRERRGAVGEEVRSLAAFSSRAGPPPHARAHIVVPALTRERALLLSARRDGRVFFVLPWGDCSLVGTTDVDDDVAPEARAARAEDIAICSKRPPAPCRNSRKPRGRSGLSRAFVRSRREARSSLGEFTRDRILEEGTMLTLIGGKYTTHRSLAERVVDRVARWRGCEPVPASRPKGRSRGGRRGSRRLRRAPSEAQAADALEFSEAEVVHAVQGEARQAPRGCDGAPHPAWLNAEAMRSALPGRARSGWPRTWAGRKRARAGSGAVMSALDREREIIDAALVTGLAPA